MLARCYVLFPCSIRSNSRVLYDVALASVRTYRGNPWNVRYLRTINLNCPAGKQKRAVFQKNENLLFGVRVSTLYCSLHAG